MSLPAVDVLIALTITAVLTRRERRGQLDEWDFLGDLTRPLLLMIILAVLMAWETWDELRYTVAAIISAI